jgi:hypothetical protein
VTVVARVGRRYPVAFARIMPDDVDAIVFLQRAFFETLAFAFVSRLRFGLDVFVAAAVYTVRRGDAVFGSVIVLLLAFLTAHDSQVVKKLGLLIQ